MLLLVAMLTGLLCSLFLKGEKVSSIAGKLQTIVTLILIFSMGYSLGSRPGFLDEVREIGILSLIYCIVPTVFSVIIVYILTSIFKKKKEDR